MSDISHVFSKRRGHSVRGGHNRHFSAALAPSVLTPEILDHTDDTVPIPINDGPETLSSEKAPIFSVGSLTISPTS